ncbi:MAG: ribosome biogenesis GTPase Der [Clostridia bacterium]|nr:ribosome biogenesis GTPase Der [Clostridia bacterium]
MKKPLVALVGRANVGKSTFFNRIIGKRISIVDDMPGVTRDRIYGDATWLNYSFSVVDTGGIEPVVDSVISKQMRRQAELAIETADVIVFMVDGRDGLVAADEEVAGMLRKSKKPIVLAVNKVDHPKYEDSIYDFYALGLGTPITVSAQQGLGLGDLLDEIVSHFAPMEIDENEDKPIMISVAGKPNVGKSSLVNALLGNERTIVSNIPGTTRDAIDTPFTYEGKEYIMVDTAGIRRKRAIEDETVERYSVIRSLDAIRRVDVVLIVIDAEQGLSEQDVRIAGYVHEEGKAAVLVVNKWDLIEKDTHTMNEFKKKLAVDLAFMNYIPMLFVSAKTGQRVNKIMDLVLEVYEQNSRRVSTGTLNDVISEAVTVTEPPSDKGRRLKIYYGTQVASNPPTFVLFVNEPETMHFSYKRYLENYLRKSFMLDKTPIRLIVRQRGKDNDIRS